MSCLAMANCPSFCTLANLEGSNTRVPLPAYDHARSFRKERICLWVSAALRT